MKRGDIQLRDAIEVGEGSRWSFSSELRDVEYDRILIGFLTVRQGKEIFDIPLSNVVSIHRHSQEGEVEIKE